MRTKPWLAAGGGRRRGIAHRWGAEGPWEVQPGCKVPPHQPSPFQKGKILVQGGEIPAVISPLFPHHPCAARHCSGSLPGRYAQQHGFTWAGWGEAEPQRGCEPGHQKKPGFIPLWSRGRTPAPPSSWVKNPSTCCRCECPCWRQNWRISAFFPNRLLPALNKPLSAPGKRMPPPDPKRPRSHRACARAVLEHTKLFLGLEANKIHQHFIAFALQI